MSSACGDESSATAPAAGGGEIMLFGVRVKVDPMRKSVSLNNLSQYEQLNANNNNSNGGGDNNESSKVVDEGYASADDAVQHQSNCGRERKRGVPWTEDEHKLFLLGLQKVGKGDWRGISRNFVKTRTPTQVASHAQKYFLRRSNLNRRRRSSLFDITTDSVSVMPIEEGGNKQEIPVLAPAALPTVETVIDLNANDNSTNEPLSLSLRLSLSLDQGQASSTRHSGYQVMSSFNNGESIISVA